MVMRPHHFSIPLLLLLALGCAGAGSSSANADVAEPAGGSTDANLDSDGKLGLSPPADASSSGGPDAVQQDADTPNSVDDIEDACPPYEPDPDAELGPPFGPECEAGPLTTIQVWTAPGPVHAVAAAKTDDIVGVAVAVELQDGEQVVTLVVDSTSGQVLGNPGLLGVEDGRANHALTVTPSVDGFGVTWTEGDGTSLSSPNGGSIWAAMLEATGTVRSSQEVLDDATLVTRGVSHPSGGMLFGGMSALTGGVIETASADLFLTDADGAFADMFHIVLTSGLAWLDIVADGEWLFLSFVHVSEAASWPFAYFLTEVKNPACTTPQLTGIDFPANVEVQAVTYADARTAVIYRTAPAGCGEPTLFIGGSHLIEGPAWVEPLPAVNLDAAYPGLGSEPLVLLGLQHDETGAQVDAYTVHTSPPYVGEPRTLASGVPSTPDVRPAAWLDDTGQLYLVTVGADGVSLYLTTACPGPI